MNQENNFSGQDRFNDEIDIRELLFVLWDGKIIISIITGLAALFSIFYSLMLPNMYTSSTLLAPVNQGQSSSIGSILGQYSGLANAAGIQLPSGNDANQAQFAIHLMKSKVFINDFVNRNNLLADLMAVEEWDQNKETITYSDIYDDQTGQWLNNGRDSIDSKPDYQDIYDEFIGLLEIDESIDTGYVTVSIKHKSPVIASAWANLLVKDINNSVRSRKIDEAKRSIEYLELQISQTPLSELQNVFFQLIQQQTETMMLAEVRREYVFNIIDPAVVQKNKTEPNRTLIVIFGSMIGATVSVFIVLFLAYVRRS